MKFLYLKGVEILGPLEAEEIIKENDFSDDLLVCPEDKAEQEAAWKPASYYPEFQISLEKEIFPIEEEKPIVNNENHDDSSFVPVIEKEYEEIPQTLPPLEDTASTITDTTIGDISFSEVMNQLSDLDKEKKSEEDEEEDIEDHTFNIAHKDDNLLEDLPAHRLIGADKDSLNTSAYEVEDLTETRRIKNTDIEKQPYETKEVNNDSKEKKDLMDISNNKIISSSDGRIKKRKSNDLLFIISFLVLTVVAVALCMAFWNVMNENTTDTETKTVEVETVETKTVDNVAKENINLVPEVQKEESFSSEVNSPQEVLQNLSVSYEDQVIDIVKNTKLLSKGRTIGEYLQDLYGADYKSAWSAKPFTDNVYIVEFFASQVRSEPYVYLFRVDVDQKKITGALNNITLDLLA